MELDAYLAAIMIRDAIERWCMYGSTILREELTQFIPRLLTWIMTPSRKSRSITTGAVVRYPSKKSQIRSAKGSHTCDRSI